MQQPKASIVEFYAVRDPKPHILHFTHATQIEEAFCKTCICQYLSSIIIWRAVQHFIQEVQPNSNDYWLNSFRSDSTLTAQKCSHFLSIPQPLPCPVCNHSNQCLLLRYNICCIYEHVVLAQLHAKLLFGLGVAEADWRECAYSMQENKQYQFFFPKTHSASTQSSARGRWPRLARKY